MFGLPDLPHRSGPLSLLYSYVDVFDNLENVNLASIFISSSCCVILLIFKVWVNQFIQDKFRVNIPFPIELILVIIGTVCSNAFSLNHLFSIQVVGQIPSGLPSPLQPDWSLVSLNMFTVECLRRW